MIIHHSKVLLENLTEIEESIHAIEGILRALGLEEDSQRILMALMDRKKANLLAEKNN
jgi:hypothetical protein